MKHDTQQMVYKNLVADLSGQSPAILTQDLTEETLEGIKENITRLKNSDRINREIDILRSDSAASFINDASLDSFMNLWFEKMRKAN